VIRRAEREDFEDLCRLEEICFGEHKFSRNHVHWILQNPNSKTLVFEKEGKIVASLMFLFQGKIARILSIAVHPSHRRKGIGRDLMKVGEELMTRLGAERIRLEVGVDNLGAINFYENLGYKIHSILENYYPWGENAYLMFKEVKR